MTLYHFCNCLALVYAPYHMTYKYSGLSEYGAFWKCVQAGAMYIFTQLSKMLLLATFFPDSDNSQITGEYDILGEILKSTVDIADLLGLYLVLAGIPGKGHSKILTAGVGWATAEVLVTRTIMLWVGARGSEFDWKYLQKCLESNIFLIQHLTTTALVWLWTRKDLNRKYLPLVSILLALTPYKGVITDSLLSSLAVGQWTALAIKAIQTCTIGVIVLNVYSVLAQQIGMF